MLTLGGSKILTQVTKTLNINQEINNRQNMSAKIHIREGKSPEQKLRF